MDSPGDSEVEARLARIEAAVRGLQHSVDLLLRERTTASASTRSAPVDEERSPNYSRSPGYSGAPDYSGAANSSRGPNSAPPPRARSAEQAPEIVASWFASHDAEWWLSRVGIGFVVLGVLLLYVYAVDHGWITPPVRVLAGATVGAALFWGALRTGVRAQPGTTSDPGLRELLLGGALALWYLTAYAAGVWYHLMPLPATRFVLFLLALVSTWIALQEHREIFALVAVATGFATPFILPAPVQSMTELSLYVGAVTAIGLIIYLMRGWQSVVWITFGAFWIIIGQSVNTRALDRATLSRYDSIALGSIAISMLLIVAAIAFTRVPALRRRLLKTGSARYTSPPITLRHKRFVEFTDSVSAALGGGRTAPDSFVVWVLMLTSALLAIDLLNPIWPTVIDEGWARLLIALAVAAIAVFRLARGPDAEIAHATLTAGVLWLLIGIAGLVGTPGSLAACALLSMLVINSAWSGFAGPRTLAKAAIVLTLLTVIGHELSSNAGGISHWGWVLSGIVVVAGGAFIARRLITGDAEHMHGMVLGGATYITGLVLIWSALYPVWPPLVTTVYAAIGAVLLILSRREGAHVLYKYLGGVTMLVVVGRLLLVDLATVETIWRVVLFLLCGAVFLYTAYQMQIRGRGATTGS